MRFHSGIISILSIYTIYKLSKSIKFNSFLNSSTDLYASFLVSLSQTNTQVTHFQRWYRSSCQTIQNKIILIQLHELIKNRDPKDGEIDREIVNNVVKNKIKHHQASILIKDTEMVLRLVWFSIRKICWHMISNLQLAWTRKKKEILNDETAISDKQNQASHNNNS